MIKKDYTGRLALHSRDLKHYDTELSREEFLTTIVFENDRIKLTYIGCNSLIGDGAVPTSLDIKLESLPAIEAEYFCEFRELGTINVGGNARIIFIRKSYELGFEKALSITQVNKEIMFESVSFSTSELLNTNSAPAHKTLSNKIINQRDVNVIEVEIVKYSKIEINKD